MKKLSKNLSRKILAGLIAVMLILGVAHLSLQYLNINYFNEESGVFFELTNRFDFDDEASVPTWVSQLLFLLISASSALLVALEKIKARKGLWLTVSIAALVGSLDEVATLHENILQSLHLLFFDESSPTVLANAWLIVAPFVLIALFIFIYKAVSLLPKKTLKLIVIAAFLYISGAVFIDIITSSTPTDIASEKFMNQGILVAIEELLELAGLSIMLYTTIDYIESKFSSKIKRAINELLK